MEHRDQARDEGKARVFSLPETKEALILGLMGAPEKSLGEQMVWEGLMA